MNVYNKTLKLFMKHFVFHFALLITCGRAHSENVYFNKDTIIPESQIIIPIQINLKPIYDLAEKNVDKVFTSPNYPSDWIQADCGTRYKYHFRRSPLQMKSSGTSMNLSFTGYYQIIGSTRACLNGTAFSPWTPACSCGFDEGERKVNVSFASSLSFSPSHQVHVKVIRKEPIPTDKCTVCFWGQDITKEIMKGLTKELDAAKKAIEDSFSIVNTRPYMQQAWNKLNQTYPVPGLGYLTLHPKKLHMENIYAKDDLLNISIGISATPVISFESPKELQSLVPNLTPSGNKNGFNIFLNAALNYDSLSHVMNQYLKGKSFDFKEAPFKKHVVIDNCKVGGDDAGNLVIDVQFSGSHNGAVSFTGKPFYNSETKSIEVAELDYDLRTKDFLLKTAKWLFNKRIISELKKYTSFSLSSYYDTAAISLNSWLNKEWAKGIRSTGKINELKLINVKAFPQHLSLHTQCSGLLNLKIDELSLSF